jgi:hypothetical protein
MKVRNLGAAAGGVLSTTASGHSRGGRGPDRGKSTGMLVSA